MSEYGPPPDPDDRQAETDIEALRRAMRWGDRPTNPRSYPARPPAAVEAEVRRSQDQRVQLEAMVAASGQADALYLAPLELHHSPIRGAYTSTTWIEGRVTVFEPADVLVLFELPATVSGAAIVTPVRWDVVARVCGARCWGLVAGLDPARLITRRWPSAAELDAIKALSLLDPRDP